MNFFLDFSPACKAFAHYALRVGKFLILIHSLQPAIEPIASRSWPLVTVLATSDAMAAETRPEPKEAAIASQKETERVFRYHIPAEPHSLDPAKLTSTDASYFFNNIMRGLLSYSNERGLIKEGAESCIFETPLKLACTLRATQWSDGSPVAAIDYVRSFRSLVSTQTKTPTVELLKNIKNALAVNRGQLPADQLGVRAEKTDRLVFEFERPDPDFLYKLTASVLVPTKTETYPPPGELAGVFFNGPYKVVEWARGKRLKLERNPFYHADGEAQSSKAAQLKVEVLFVDDDETALNLYESHELSFLRRLPTMFIAKFKTRADFKQIPVARFDYVGFGEDLKDQPELRAALSFAADYREMKKMLDALGIPGCPSLPEELVDKPHCIQFDLSLAKKHWANVPPEAKQRRYHFYFSKLGGDDVKRSMEWFQAQWKKNLGFQVDLEQMEQGAYLQLLRTKPPAIFRKGVGLERPTCLAALETFASGGSENFLKLDNPKYAAIVAQLLTLNSTDKSGLRARPGMAAKETCGQGIQFLLDSHWLIPLGRIHFTLLADPYFRGWSLNEMNQLDLSHLEHQ